MYQNISSLAHLQSQYDLLQKEYLFEKEQYKEQAEQAGILHRIRQGLCWYPVRIGRSYYNSLNQLVVEIERTQEKEIEHVFEHGRPVCFFKIKTGQKLDYFNFSANISYVEGDVMLVSVPSQQALAELQTSVSEIGVQLYFDETSYKTMFAALKEVMSARNDMTAHLREVLLGAEKTGERKIFPLRFPWLNASQDCAVNKVLAAKDLSIVHGPPGTGKTTTLVEAIYETLHRENQVLVCAQSNTAVDWIAEKLTDRGVPVLRIGNPTRVNDKMLSFTYERKFESHPDYAELWSIRKAIREIQSSLRKKSRSEKDTERNRLSRLRYRATELELSIETSLFDEARVIACTLVGSANKVLTGKRFSTLFIDEAAQALEAACWIAINKSDRVILAGDHKQLPPTVKCIEALRGGLDKTLMEYIAERKPETVSLLKIQYRMHNDIMGFSSQWFYNGELYSAPEVRNRGILDWDTPLVWTDTAGYDLDGEDITDNLSRINRKEAELLVLQLQVYMENIGKDRILEENIDFGIISPYKAQVYYLRSLIKRNSFFRPFRKLITIHTVDGFQGQERDVILISLVRANDDGNIGFLKDLRRMNVAITRARMKLIILGDSETLSKHTFYRKLYRYIEERGKVIKMKE